MRKARMFGLVITLVLSATSGRAQGASELVGTYKLVSGEKGSSEIPKTHLDGVVRITNETMTLYDKDNNEVYVMGYGIDGEKMPYRITMTVTKSTRPDAVGTKARGLIKVVENRVTLIYDYKGADFPSDFHPKGDTQHFFVMERMNEK